MTPNKYRPKFTIYHPNGRGTGAAMCMELVPAGNDADTASGFIAITLAPQATAPAQGRGFATFDWKENAVKVKLDAGDLGKVVQLFRGETESLEDGKGLYHRSSKAATAIRMRHVIEPCQGYELEIARTPYDADGKAVTDDAKAVRILIPPHEATAIDLAIEGAMTFVTFGIPQIFRYAQANG